MSDAAPSGEPRCFHQQEQEQDEDEDEESKGAGGGVAYRLVTLQPLLQQEKPRECRQRAQGEEEGFRLVSTVICAWAQAAATFIARPIHTASSTGSRAEQGKQDEGPCASSSRARLSP